jgi:hypothetical protein
MNCSFGVTVRDRYDRIPWLHGSRVEQIPLALICCAVSINPEYEDDYPDP